MSSSYFDSEDEKLKWHENSEKTILKTRVFDVMEINSTASDGKTCGNYVVCNAPNWVIVIPKQNENFIMVKQWRHGEKNLSIEFPGGVIEKDESPENAALRELKEETGIVPEKITFLGNYNPNPALFSNKNFVFLAENLSFTKTQQLDKDEFVNCIEISQKDVLEGMGTEAFPHALMASALCLFFKHEKIAISVARNDETL